jgi:hypothetical protein
MFLTPSHTAAIRASAPARAVFSPAGALPGFS